METVSLSGPGQYSLSLAVFEAADAKAVIQVIHGMEEHKERYYDFAAFLAENGFNVVISDLRGHGSDAPVLSHIADEHGDDLLIEDQQVITGYIGSRFPGLPILIFAHSMGTIIARVLLQTDSGRYAAALGNSTKLLKGSKGHSSMLTKLALGAYATSIENRKTNLDWLSYDTENVRKYIEDPLCGVEFSIGSYCALFNLLNRMGKTKEYRKVRAEMPILLIAGRDDPCTGGDKGRADSRSSLSSAGFNKVSVITYDHMRHEILNEKDHRVYEDLLDFFKKTVQ